jgi:hypothetical protein
MHCIIININDEPYGKEIIIIQTLIGMTVKESDFNIKWSQGPTLGVHSKYSAL